MNKLSANQLTEKLWEAAKTGNSGLALEVATEIETRQLWMSNRRFIPTPPNGTEVFRVAGFPGMCEICKAHFPRGTDIMWRTNSSTHLECWESYFNKKVFNAYSS